MSSASDAPAPSELAARVRRRLNARAEPEGVAAKRWAFREAAALLSYFDPTRLRLRGDGAEHDALITLLDDCEVIGEPTRGVWTLKWPVRKAALRRLEGREGALRAFEANRECGVDPVERRVHDYLRQTAPELGGQHLDSLACTVQAVRWLREIPGIEGLPTVKEILAVQRRKQLFDPLESLAGDGFHGRDRELDTLRLHVGVLDPKRLRTRVRSAGRKINPFTSGKRSPLMVHGPPGIGKSTLLAKLVLEHSRETEGRIPFVFIDFERPTLSELEPTTVIVEAARQLGIQYPVIEGPLGEIEAEAAHEAARQREAADEVDELQGVSTTRTTVHRELVQKLREEAVEAESRLIHQLVATLRKAPAAGNPAAPPLLFVLDSFEQAQYRSSPYLRQLWDMFISFQDAYPRIRVVVSGRAPVEQLEINRRRAEYLELKEFDTEAATAFLIDEGVAPDEFARQLAEKFGGNPLSLKLTAKLAKREKTDRRWTDEVETKEWLGRHVKESQIQLRLYLRLLASINDKSIAKLAHPGLILRRITPDVIRYVLAEPCEVEVPDHERADALFDEFARQVDLVSPTGPRELSHRPDVRRDMLPLVEEDKPREVEQVERLAVEYWRRQEGPAARAEQIYHRLRLGEPPADVDAAWEEGVGRFLHVMPQEVPARALAYLAAKHKDGRVPPEVLEDAEFRDWETLTAREVQDLLEQSGEEQERRNSAKAALELMQAREGWTPGSPLYRLKADALAIVGDQKTAEEAVEAGISAIDDQPGSRTASVSSTLLDLLLTAARLYQSRGQERIADLKLADAERLAERLDRGLDVLSTQLYRLRLRGSIDEPRTAAGDVGERAARRFLATDEETLRRQPVLVRSMAVELGAENGDVLDRAIQVLGAQIDRPGQHHELAAQVRELQRGDERFAAWLYRFAGDRGVRLHDDSESVNDLIDRLNSTGDLSQLARALVARSEDGSPLRVVVIDLLPETAADTLLGGDLGVALS